MEIVLKYGLLFIAYLIGAIPFSVILGTKIKGIDIRQHGSGNPGGTNALRFLGKHVGILIILLDGLKGGLLVLLLMHTNFLGGYDLLHPLAYGVAAAIGHAFPVYLKFKGGKAVACTVGIAIGYNVLFAFIMFLGFMLVLKLWKYVSLASTAAAVTAVLIALVVQDYQMLLYFGLLMLLIMFRHKKNYHNISQGIEPKVSWI
ncbi:MAG: glycerol-3-phosphate 1-O-acyltransferase PlsY [Candidatus Izemoplasma sp.]|nr:glycerol-3-phosphate 1-O-acyltransferase PlsY [Candidatus Izemoplasma sp.]